MPISNKQMPDDPNILVSTVTDPIDLSTDPQKSLGELQSMLASTKGTVHLIVDCLGVHPSFSDMVIGMATSSSDPKSPLRSERLKTIIVAEGKIFQSMVTWHKQSNYGELDMPLFKTVDEALKFVKKG